MIDIHIEKALKQLMQALQLGNIIGTPAAVSGGLMHKMYAVETTQGKYAVKALNPQIMLRPEALHNFIRAERIAQLAAADVPALPAKVINGEFLHRTGDRCYLVFDWIDGVRLQPGEVEIEHCISIGGILAAIHRTDFSELAIPQHKGGQASPTDWNTYLRQGQKVHAEWAGRMLGIIDELYSWEDKATQSARRSADDQAVLSHGDLDPKNVMWRHNSPVVIDWEAAGYVQPMLDLTETAIYWSEDEEGDVDQPRFSALLKGYRNRGGVMHADWRSVLEQGFLGKLGWLAYNLRRSLGLECADEDEQRLGTEQAVLTIQVLRRYAERLPEYEKWLMQEM
ncbi:phosphotransferase [Paenibacillus rhizovicinus]|uniref:Phosphotransferase n=1 Tax=Paenibacillus rhizovicinus TaxID=2704463 RepID=A0A6C0NWH5_9BACL|nr:phosphotransferase [Paenibacillus rhizovicinus]QHW30266.1 phosphotransferase [Paenibacillus rhizovicinus]